MQPFRNNLLLKLKRYIDIIMCHKLYPVGQKQERLANIAAVESRKSTGTFKLGAIIYQGKKKICAGYNTNDRTTYRKNICCSVHAEMDTVTRFLNSFIKIHITRNPDKIRRKMSKYSICVVRSIIGEDGNLCLMSSLPCQDCLHKLKMIGLNKVIYSENKNIRVARLSQIEHNKYTSVMKKPGVIQMLRLVPLIRL
jgi:deoxycytidylate deaminase